MDRNMLAGKVAFITGAGHGIGRGIVHHLARCGAAVAIAEIDSEAGCRTADEIKDFGGRSIFIETDVGHKASVDLAIARCIDGLGALDILVNNAIRIPKDLLLEEKTDDMLSDQLSVGLWGPWWAMHAAFPIMKKAGGGRIINFTSGDVHSGAWFHADYSIAKGAVEALTRSAANEWARFNILVNAVAPVGASTAYERICRDRPGFEALAEKAVPLGRVGDPERDIAPVVAFLALDAAGYITGSTLHADGGIHLSRVNTKPAILTKS